MRLPLAAVALLLALVVTGCESGSDGDPLEAARYLNPEAQLVAAIDLDYEGDQWLQLKRLYARVAGESLSREVFGTQLPATLDGGLETLARGAGGLSFDRDVRPVLDGKALIGLHVTPAPPLSGRARDVLERVDRDEVRFDERLGRQVYVDRAGKRLDTREVEAALRERDERQPRTEVNVAYRVGDGDALDELLGRFERQGLERRPLRGAEDTELLGDGVAVAGGDTLVAVFGENLPENRIEALLRERLRGNGPARRRLPAADGEALASVRATPGLLGLLLDRDELRRATRTREVRALRTGDLRLRLRQTEARLDGGLDFTGLRERQLPLPPPGPVELPRDAGIGSGASNQSRTTVFFARLVRRLYPRSRFVRRVKALERRERLRFEDAVLRQFSGPSQSILRPTAGGETLFAARSSLRDPAAMRRLLPRLAPRLPGILEGLEGLGQVGLSGLLLVAPDAPLTPSAFGLLAAVEVRPLPKARRGEPSDPEELLYEITGLEQDRGVPGLDRVVYGVIGEKFVVASDRALARTAAELPTVKAEPAGARLRVDVARLLGESGETDEAARLLDVLVGAIEVQASAEKGDIVARGTARLPRR